MRLTSALQAAVVLACATIIGCKPSDVLSVPPPVGVNPAGTYNSQSGAELLENNGIARVAQGFSQYDYGVLMWAGQLADEFRWSDFPYDGAIANIDARFTAAVNGFTESGDMAIQSLMAARVTLLTALPLLIQYEPSANQSKIGMAYAMIGYTELLSAEDFCAGLPLGQITSSGVQYGQPLTTDSIFATAEAHFDSALKYANNDATVVPLASVGLARARLNRANYTGAATAVANVPTSFVYNAQLQAGGDNQGGLTVSNMYAYDQQYAGCGDWNAANSKGGNGMNYITANDPRLVFNTTIQETCDGLYGGPSYSDSVWYYPMKFGLASTSVPLATGVEARLVEAEAALQAGNAGGWAMDLNNLRANAPGTYLALDSAVQVLPTDSTTSAPFAMQVDVMFRERAFWLYGTGTRLGDMRRLIRQYGRDQSTVFAVGPFPNGNVSTLPSPLPNYGTDVNLTLPTAAGGYNDPNPAYKGCINKSA
jgi:starch-binding outer membrane protein, SusD/RagB family